ncbi:hypothetical protein SAMN02745166_04039 [Prosthecobacter debontii]|uniref:Uncharacterized protein n=2 Tax=Prosthecobacter debontii TaxID=48467 RepID=A0A1T4YRG2_9BACT|nr:hypothetical protein SAMN02745166_04039 [Prosthecobacter debontii]
MAKRRSGGGGELNLDSLMDAVTNVVGVLMIVLVMMALNTARTVQKILSDLPPVTKEEHEQMQAQIKALPPPPADPKKIEEDKIQAEADLKKAIEQLRSVDTSDMAAKMKFMDLDSFRAKLEEAKKKRDGEKTELDKLLAEIERLKALLDETPVYEPPPPKYVRLPNPRPFPEKAVKTRVLVAEQGVLMLNEQEFVKPIIDGLDKVKSQLEYKETKIDPFKDMLTKIFGSPQAAQQAWPEIAPLVNTFQMDQVANAYKALAAAGLQPNKAMLTALGDVTLAIRSNLQSVAEAVVAATKGDLAKWLALDPSKDPLKPTLKAVQEGNKITFTYGSKTAEVKTSAKDVLNYFIKDLADLDGVKNRGRSKVIYDAFKIQAMLEKAASSPTITGAFAIKPMIRPGSTTVQIALAPKAGGGETLAQMQAEGSNYQRTMRQIKGDPNGVAVFQVMSNAFDTYLEARKIADDIGVPAAWEFLAKLDLTVNVNGYEVQRFAEAPKPVPPKPGQDTVTIKPPTGGLD